MNRFDRYVAEDLGPRGDATTRALFGAARQRARARIVCRQRLVAAGLLEAVDAFAAFRVRAEPRVAEGSWARTGSVLVTLDGPLGGILAGERLALNLVGRMSGIATQTRRLQARVARVNPTCRVAATRKTTPGFRVEEKRAVALGGGDPHRYGLYDAILIKDNHLAALGGDVGAAVSRALAFRPRLPVEVEVTTAEEATAAARAGADWVLIDNQPPGRARRIAQAARRANPRVRIESSGRLGPETLERYAAFSDRLSLGLLTHSAASADVALDLVRGRSAKP